jgi:Heterokaryon incompatibility protein (HET)
MRRDTYKERLSSFAFKIVCLRETKIHPCRRVSLFIPSRSHFLHTMEWSREDILHGFDMFVSNYVPIRLIYVPEMKLVRRDDLRSYIENDLQTSISNYQRFLKQGVTQARLDFKELTKYAIFSHRWLPSGEPTFDDVTSGKLPSGAGTQKLQAFCAKAKELGCMFAWSDTCCIDKSSSAELEESIRSMFRWYRNSHICITYLANSTSLHDLKDDPWFTRGWTLQELIAPKRLKLFGKDFVPLTKDRNDKDPKSSTVTLQSLSDISEIPVDSLLNCVPGLEKVRQRLSWASRRHTTRIEDMAYCLVGLLDISLPISYGEGNRAFFRLMQTIVQETTDSLIFAWTGMASPYNSAFPLAPSGYRLTAALEKESSGASHEGGELYYTMANGYLKSTTLYFELKIKGETVRDKLTVITVTNPDLGDTEVVLPRGAIAPALWGKFKSAELSFWIINYDADDKTGSYDVVMKQGRSYIAMLISFYRGQPERIGTENIVEVQPKTTLKHRPQPLFIHRLSYEAEGTVWPEIQLYMP